MSSNELAEVRGTIAELQHVHRIGVESIAALKLRVDELNERFSPTLKKQLQEMSEEMLPFMRTISTRLVSVEQLSNVLNDRTSATAAKVEKIVERVSTLEENGQTRSRAIEALSREFEREQNSDAEFFKACNERAEALEGRVDQLEGLETAHCRGVATLVEQIEKLSSDVKKLKTRVERVREVLKVLEPPPEKEFPLFCCTACGGREPYEVEVEADRTFGSWKCLSCGHCGTFTDADDFPSVQRYEEAKIHVAQLEGMKQAVDTSNVVCPSCGHKAGVHKAVDRPGDPGKKDVVCMLMGCSCRCEGVPSGWVDTTEKAARIAAGNFERQSAQAAKLSKGWSTYYQKYIEDLRAAGMSVHEIGDCVVVGVPEDNVEKIRQFFVQSKSKISRAEDEARRRRTSPAFDRAVDPLGQIEKGKEPPVLFNGVRVGHVAAFKHVPGVKGLVADIVFDKDTPFEPWAGHTAGVELPESSGYPVRKVNLRTSIKATTSNEPPPEYVAAAFEARDRGQIQDATDHPAWSDFEYEIPGGLTAGRTIPELLKSRVFWWESWLKFRNGWNACRDKYRDDASHGN